MATAGYSGTPLAKKLGIREGSIVCAVEAPPAYVRLLGPLPDGASIAPRFTAKADIVHLFVTKRTTLVTALARYRGRIHPDAAVWVSWPKKASRVPTDITEDGIRSVCLPLGFVDVKVCAVDETWSGLKLVIRKALRGDP